MRTYCSCAPRRSPPPRFGTSSCGRPTRRRDVRDRVGAPRLPPRAPGGVPRAWAGRACRRSTARPWWRARPRRSRFELALPPRPWLDLAVGTVEDGPVTFRVALGPRAGAETLVLERTVTTPHRWEPLPLDLARLAGRQVDARPSAERGRGRSARLLGRAGGAQPRRRAAARRSARRLRAAAGHVILSGRTRCAATTWASTATPRDDAPSRAPGREGALFDDCVGQATWTKVATPSLLTSLYPTSHGVHDFLDRLPASGDHAGRGLPRGRLRHAVLSSILFTGQFTNLHQGFEEVHEDGSLPERDRARPRAIRRPALPWLEAHRDLPFFVFLHVPTRTTRSSRTPPYDTLWADPAKREEHERQGKELRKFIADPLLKASACRRARSWRRRGWTRRLRRARPRLVRRLDPRHGRRDGPADGGAARAGARPSGPWSSSPPTTARSSSSTAAPSTARASTAR